MVVSSAQSSGQDDRRYYASALSVRDEVETVSEMKRDIS